MDDGTSFKTPAPDATLFGGPDDGLEIQFASDENRPSLIDTHHAVYQFDDVTERYVYLKDHL